MKGVLVITFFTYFSINLFGQTSSFEINKFKFEGMGLINSKDKIIENFGEPEIKEATPDFSSEYIDSLYSPYFILEYEFFSFRGKDNESYHLYIINFDMKGNVKLEYDGNFINVNTTKNDLGELLGKSVAKQLELYPDHDDIIISKDMDADGVRFSFENNQLKVFQFMPSL